MISSMHGAILLNATRKSLPGLWHSRALVLTTVSAENPCSQRYVVENSIMLIFTNDTRNLMCYSRKLF